MRRSSTIANPAVRGGARRVSVTDRALRYRASKNPPPGPRRCHYCGRPGGRLDVEHVDGREENGARANLSWACRSCNTRKGVAFRNSGIGRRTRQYNPGGARTVGQWLQAVMSLKGQGDMELADAIALVHATPHSKRSEFAREIWAKRRARGEEVPF